MFFFLPFSAFFLTTEEFGVAGIVIPFIQNMQGVITVGLPLSILKFYNDRKSEHKIIDFNVSVYYLVVLLFFLLVIYLLNTLQLFENYKIGDYKVSEYSYLIFLTIFLSATVTILLQKYQALKNVKLFVITNASSRLVVILLLLYFILFQDVFIATDLVYCILFSGIIFSVITFSNLLIGSVKKFNKRLLKEISNIGLPLMINGVFSFVLSMNGRFVLENEFGIKVVGSYAFVFSISQFLFLALAIYNRIYLPELFRVLALNKIKESNQFIVKNLLHSTIIMCCLALVFLPIGFLISLIYNNPDYSEYIRYLPLSVLSFVPYSLYLTSTNYLAYRSLTYLTLTLTVVIGLFSLGANIILIRKLGAEGLFITQVIFQFLFALSISFVANKKGMDFNYFKYFKITIFAILILIVMVLPNLRYLNIIWGTVSILTTIFLFIYVRNKKYKILL